MCGREASRPLAASGFDRGGGESEGIAIDSSGGATLYSGSMSQGHGHATALTQIAADALQMPVENYEGYRSPGRIGLFAEAGCNESLKFRRASAEGRGGCLAAIGTFDVQRR